VSSEYKKPIPFTNSRIELHDWLKYQAESSCIKYSLKKRLYTRSLLRASFDNFRCL